MFLIIFFLSLVFSFFLNNIRYTLISNTPIAPANFCFKNRLKRLFWFFAVRKSRESRVESRESRQTFHGIISLYKTFLLPLYPTKKNHVSLYNMQCILIQDKEMMRNIIYYGIIGCLASFVDFVFFYILSRYCGLFYIAANCISVLIGITTSFILNRTYNFKVFDKTPKRFITFLTVGLLGLCLSNLILWIGVDLLEGDSIVVKIFCILIVAAFQFTLNKFITFRKSS